MSMPNIPTIAPTISITQEEAINLQLAAIALEEIGLSHVINSEAEKIQSRLGTLEGLTPEIVPLDELLALDQTVERVLEKVIIKEILLLFTLDRILDFLRNDDDDDEEPGTGGEGED